MGRSVQAQTVLYHNEIPALLRSMDSIANAVIQARKLGAAYERYALVYGDASKTPLFSQTEVEALKKQYQSEFSFQYIFFDQNTGSALGQNKLSELADTDDIFIMNPDIVLSPTFFVEIVKPFALESTGMVEARQTPVEHPKQYDLQTGETDWGSGACTLLPTALFRALNGYDADTFFMYCDDLDLSWRLRLTGKKIIYQPTAVVFHAKRLNEKGKWCAGEAERYYSAEAALLISYKYHRPDFHKLLQLYQNSPSEVFRKAFAAFEARRLEGRLPEQLDPQHKIARFYGHDYQKNRFAL